MKDIPKRKIILLALIAVLLVVYIIQISFSGRTDVRTVVTEAAIDSVEVTKNDDTVISIRKENEKWMTGDSPVMENRANGIVNSVNEIKILGTTSRNADDSERYGLNKENALKVTAFSEGNVVRTLYIGKNSTTGSQCYIQIDNDSNIYLAQGALRSTFEISADEIIEKPAQEDAADITE